MPPRRKFDKNTSTTFALVHRAQNDPLIHDENAPSMVFTEKVSRRNANNDDYDAPISSASSAMSGASSFSRRGKQRGDLEEEFGMNFRPNEGEAAQHGVYYDDTKYDYMQHMKDLGSGEGPATWIEAKQPKAEGKGKQRLEDALRDMDISSNAGSSYGGVAQSVGQSSMASSVARSLLPEDVLPSEFVTRRSYQDQQDVPDAIAGFQPDMDPRLRETLEALEDEAYVDDEDDFFGDLVAGGREIDQDEWERLGEQQMFEEGEGELDDGWESDDTIKAGSPREAKLNIPQPADGELIQPPKDTQAALPADPTEGAWLDEFKKFKHEAKANQEAGRPAKAAPSAFDASLISSLASRPGKKRKGAKTSTSNYSMSSSALVRTDQQNLLDDRFDKLEEQYTIAEEGGEYGDEMEDSMSAASGMTGMSKASHMSKYSQMSGLSGISGISSYSRATDSEAPMLQRADFDNIMDDFLGNHKISGKASRKLQRFGPQTGMEQLDEVRKGLGKARRTGRAATGAAR